MSVLPTAGSRRYSRSPTEAWTPLITTSRQAFRSKTLGLRRVGQWSDRVAPEDP